MGDKEKKETWDFPGAVTMPLLDFVEWWGAQRRIDRTKALTEISVALEAGRLTAYYRNGEAQRTEIGEWLLRLREWPDGMPDETERERREMDQVRRSFVKAAEVEALLDHANSLIGFDQLARSAEVTSIEAPLRTRERKTLLVIIAALAKEAKIDISRSSKTASLISDMTDRLGASVSARTIEGHLKRIPEALESRAKS